MNSLFRTREIDHYPTFRKWYRTYMPVAWQAWMASFWPRTRPVRRVIGGLVMLPVGVFIVKGAFGLAGIAEFQAAASRLAMSGESWRILQAEVVGSGLLIVYAALHAIFRPGRKNPIWVWAFGLDALVSYGMRAGTRLDPLYLDVPLFWMGTGLMVVGVPVFLLCYWAAGNPGEERVKD